MSDTFYRHYTGGVAAMSLRRFISFLQLYHKKHKKIKDFYCRMTAR